ncbi:forkhead-associated protein, partial [Bifidobacterium parmae]
FTPMGDASGAVAADPTAVAADGFEDDATGVYTPAFEPGSVFDKVSKGEFDKPQTPMVEVDGLTSEDARHTTDMTLQFEMARHPELLPFLAMNPALYDDLYAWLAAQGDADIDEALAHNVGYQDYREATGK